MTKLPISTRREFLTRGFGLIGVGATIPQFLVQTALAGPTAAPGQNILVVLQLSGGNDGLSTVVPYADDNYHRARRITRITTEDVLKIDRHTGLHPNLDGFLDLLDDGQLSIIQGVGYPNPNRSHFQSMDIWHAANLVNPRRAQGWLGRYAERTFADAIDPELGIAVGSDQAPLALQGANYGGLSLQRPETFRFFGENQVGENYGKLMGLDQMNMADELGYITRTTVAANAASEKIRQIAARYRSSVAYPRSALATSLQTVAGLIAGGLSTRVYYVFQGGYDTHAGQRQRHDRLMRDLGDAVLAFQKDLAAQGNSERVLTMGFSEFGRRVQENGSQGTDHGAAGPMFLVGPGVKAGLNGPRPNLSGRALDRGDIRFSIDFRSVYATVLENWLGAPSAPILGEQFPLVECLG